MIGRRLLSVALVVIATLASIATAPAHADIVRTTFSVTVPTSATDWTHTVKVPGFQPTGPNSSLIAVEVTITGQVGGRIAFENLDASPVSVQATLRARVAVSAWGTELAATVPEAVRTDDLTAFDGIVDDDGSSGRTWTDIQASAIGTATISDPATVAQFVAKGSISLPVAGVGDPVVLTSTAPVQIDAQRVDAGAVIDITYVAATDTTAPPAPDVTGPSSPSNSYRPSWSFTAETGATTACELDGPSGEVEPWKPCSSPYVADLKGESDGSYVLSVRATDAAGNTGPSATSAYVLDRTPPAVPSFSSEPPSPSDDPTPTWTFTAEAGAATECALDSASFAPCANPTSADLAAGTDGVHTFTVRAIDAAGNTGPAAYSYYILDRLAPGAPTIGPPPSPSNDPTPTWTISAEAGSSTECAVDGGAYTACGSTFTADLTTAADGVHVMTARATDAAGNVSSESTSSYVLDRAAPDRPVVTAPASPGSTRAPVWGIVAEPGSTSECSLDARPWVWCGATFTADLNTAADGAYTLRVHAIDGAGNIGPAAAATYVLDTTAPTAPVITGHPANPSADDRPRWTFSVEAGSTATCSVDGGAWTACSGWVSADLTAAADDSHSFAVRATDAAGNTGPSASSTYVLDRTAPPAPGIIDAPPSPGNDSTPTWTFTIPVDDTAECAVDGGTFTACDGWFSPNLTSAPDGLHHVAIRAIDAAGNRSESATGAYVLDRDAPAAPQFTVEPPKLSNDRFPVWSFTAEPGTVTMCSLDEAAPTVCAVSYTADLSDAADGHHTFAVHAVDAAGNVGKAETGKYELDATGPAAPVFTSGPTGRSRDVIAQWTFTAEYRAETECSLDQAAWVSCTDEFTADLTDALDGAHSLAVRAIDGAGNIGPAAESAYVLDRLAPLAPTFTARPMSPSKDRAPAWQFTAEAGATTECSLDGGDWEPCTDSYQPGLRREADGAHTIAVRATDIAGNIGPAAISSYVLDTTPPPAPIVTWPPSPSNVEAPTWALQTPPGARLECSVDSSPFAKCDGSITTDFSGRDGVHVLRVRALDDAGNVSESTTANYVLDTVAPDAPVIDGTPADNPQSPRWRFHAEPNTWTECSLDGGDWQPCVDSVRVGWNSSSTLAVRAVDDAGNRSSAAIGTFVPRSAQLTPTTKIEPPSSGGGTLERTTAFVPPSPAIADAPRAVPSPPPAPRPSIPFALRPFAELLPDAVRVIQSAAEHGSIPFALMLVVAVFLALQDRIDRRDPKLALAPLRDEPEYVEFTDNPGVDR